MIWLTSDGSHYMLDLISDTGLISSLLIGLISLTGSVKHCPGPSVILWFEVIDRLHLFQHVIKPISGLRSKLQTRFELYFIGETGTWMGFSDQDCLPGFDTVS